MGKFIDKRRKVRRNRAICKTNEMICAQRNQEAEANLEEAIERHTRAKEIAALAYKYGKEDE